MSETQKQSEAKKDLTTLLNDPELDTSNEEKEAPPEILQVVTGYPTYPTYENNQLKTHEYINEELDYMRVIRRVSIPLLSILTLILVFWVYSIVEDLSKGKSQLDSKIAIALITAVFVNFFWAIRIILTYAFSPLKDTMDFVQKLKNGENKER
ncbi:MAG TPA: hypothetical protein VIG73_07265 [Cerasibacillus sp.]|uniref:hypothetical protein n=1 Tax=Cerasibacillus sp. TaxID=2498711 RepID=UPI002F3FD89F